MSLFGPRFYSAPEPNFSGLFRLIDDFDKYSSQNGPEGSGSGSAAARFGRHHIPTFTPKFDLRETDGAYELHGELPGIEKKNVHIEFTDPQTIVIRGKVERTHTEGTPPVGLLEGSDNNMSGAITEGGEEKHNGEARRNSHQPTVEDEPEADSTAQSTPATTVAETVKSEQQQQPQKPAVPKAKYWVSERSIGEFSRTFNFPTRVETDEVQASLNNGVLAVTVPKAKKHESRRIAIN